MARIVFYLGGARSGKSRLAEARLKDYARVGYIATAQELDDEMRLRIQVHRGGRSPAWSTVEEPLDLSGALVRVLRDQPEAILIDCLTLWSSNHLLKRWNLGWTPQQETVLLQTLESVVRQLQQCPIAEAVLVSNEVGCGIVPDNPMGRAYRDLLGRINQSVGALADEVHLISAGLSIRLK